jgi:nitrogen fixation/metabolism regulation signal transduction histidine kinase
MILSLLDLGFLVLLGTIVAQRILSIWMRRRRNQAGSRLQVRMISVFTMLAVAPAILVAMFAAIFFYFGVETWFQVMYEHLSMNLLRSLKLTLRSTNRSFAVMSWPWPMTSIVKRISYPKILFASPKLSQPGLSA